MKKSKILGVFVLMILSTLLHFVYELAPCFLTSIIAPVNESIWEHMKLIFFSHMIFSIIEYFYLGKEYNLFKNIYLVGTIGILIYLSIYLPVRLLIGEEMILVTLLILFITYIIMQVLSYYILKEEDNYIYLVLIILNIIIFGILTYFPPKLGLFYDTETGTYGIPK